MRHRQKKVKLSRDYDHRRALVKNLVRSLFLHGRIETTLTKAKAALPLSERIINRIKRNNLTGRRFAYSLFGDQKLVNQIATLIVPRFKNNQGGVVRLRKIKKRKGDNALIVALELIDGKGGIILAQKEKQEEQIKAKGKREKKSRGKTKTEVKK